MINKKIIIGCIKIFVLIIKQDSVFLPPTLEYYSDCDICVHVLVYVEDESNVIVFISNANKKKHE